VLDLDVKAYFDSIGPCDWELMLKAVPQHTNCPWVLLYIELIAEVLSYVPSSWLRAPNVQSCFVLSTKQYAILPSAALPQQI
jgi:hypothetical protein